jgi:thioredoxin 1
MNEREVMSNLTIKVTDQSFSQDVLSSQTPVLVDFWAEWCGPCRALAPKLEEIAQQLKGKVIVAKVNVDENSKMAEKYGIRGIPAMLLFKNGAQVGQLIGNQPKPEIEKFLSSHV